MLRKILSLVVIFCVISYSKCEKINKLECGNADPKGLCQINEIRINPCKESEQNKPCVFSKGISASIDIDIQALKAIESLKGQPFGVVLGSEVGWAGIDKNACNFIQCPMTEGSNQTYSFQLKIQKNFARGMFFIKVKFWDDTKEGCCSSFYVKLV